MLQQYDKHLEGDADWLFHDLAAALRDVSAEAEILRVERDAARAELDRLRRIERNVGRYP